MEQYIQEKEHLLNFSEKIAKLCRDANFKELEKKNKAISLQLVNSKFYITIVGEFNRGKSTLVNAFLRADIIPTAIRETTATINVISYADTPSVMIIDSNGNRTPVNFSKQTLKEFTALSDFDSSTVDHIELNYPASLLEKNIVLVDTPGVNDINQQRAEITYGFMPLSNATIFLLDSQKPFTATEQNFVKEQILANNIPTLFFIINKLDYLDSSKHDAVFQDVKHKLTITLGTEPKYLNCISSGVALKGFLENDHNKLEKSGFLEFEKSLVEFLSSNQRTKTFLLKSRMNLAWIITQYLTQIEIEISQNGKSLRELLIQKEALANSEAKIRSEFTHIVKYLDTDLDAILNKIETSLLHKFKELQEVLILEIESLQHNLQEYGEKILPFKIKQNIKNWMEQNISAIEEFLTFSMANAGTAFEASFTQKPLLARINPTFDGFDGLEKQKISIGGNDKIEQAEHYAMSAGALFVGGLAILTGGLSLTVIMPSIIGLSVGKNLISPFFTKKIIEDQKSELKLALSSALHDTQSHVLNELKSYLNSYYASLKEQLHKEFDSTFQQTKKDIQNRIYDFSTQEKRKDDDITKLENLKSEMLQLQQAVMQQAARAEG